MGSDGIGNGEWVVLRWVGVVVVGRSRGSDAVERV